MVVWGSDEPKAPRTSTETAPSDSHDVLADARSWGFCHGVCRPHLPNASAPRR